MKKIYIDCNVLLDWILNRKPFDVSAKLLVELISRQQIIGYVSPLAIANVHYFVRKKFGKEFALDFAKQCQKLFKFCDNSGHALNQAIDNYYKDFEDDIHFYSAIHSGIDTLVTRNPKDFPKLDSLSIVTPDELLYSLGY